MPLHTAVPKGLKEADVIIVGGGTSGCIVAARLSDADPNLSVLVVESGPDNRRPEVEYPALFASHLTPTTTTAAFYQTAKEKALGDRQLLVPAGACLGGGSSINFMMYSRGHASDFDDWKTPGWTAQEMLPYLNKLETYHGADPRGCHGHEGPVQISPGTFSSPRATDDFISAAGKVGFPEVADLQNQLDTNGVSRAMKFISPEGKRQDSASVYIHPRLIDGKHPNLDVLVETQVVRVLLEGGKAVGVECRANSALQPEEAAAGTKTIKAKKMVILAGGAFGSPLLLERSGIGSAEVLQRAGVPLVVDLPGVGAGYQDHELETCCYKSDLAPEETMDVLMDHRWDVRDLIMENDKVLGGNAQEVAVKVRPTDEEVAALGPEFEAAWKRDFKDKPDKPMIAMAFILGFGGIGVEVPSGQYISTTAFSLHPYARGHVHITPADASAPADFATGYFADEHGLDLKMHMWAYKKAREIVRRMAHYRGEVAIMHPPFAADSEAACIEPTEPLPADVKDIRYSAEDDAVLAKWLIERVVTTWHSLGTCKMAPREEMGVVDAKLGVYGVQGLKVADMAIVPGNISGNTNDTAMAIGERAADIFIEELELGGK